jgi:hypothetical protein
VVEIHTVPAVSRRTRIMRTDWTLCVERDARSAPVITVDARGRESARYDSLWESRFDVFIRHVDGIRIPMGPNLFSDPGAEETRLLRLVDPPSFIGPYLQTEADRG